MTEDAAEFGEESVTEDAAEFAGSRPRSSRRGPATRRSTAPTRRSSRAAPPPVRVVDDPDDGIPIVHVPRGRTEAEGDGGASGLHAPIRTCAGCGRKAPQARAAALPRARRASSSPGRGRGRGVYTCRRLACFERARAHRGFNRILRRTVRVEESLARLYT